MTPTVVNKTIKPMPKIVAVGAGVDSKPLKNKLNHVSNVWKIVLDKYADKRESKLMIYFFILFFFLFRLEYLKINFLCISSNNLNLLQ